MNKALISLMIVLAFVVVSCGEDDAACPENNKFCHSHDGLDWSDASSDFMTWFEAVTYCVNLGGRLPAISELRTLIQNCPRTVTGGVCGVTDDCLSPDDCWSSACYGCDRSSSGKYSVFGDPEPLWSSSELSDIKGAAWYVVFLDGGVVSLDRPYEAAVRCVK